MSKKVIAIDVDDVLAANAAGFVAYSNKRWGTNLSVDDYNEHWSNLWQVDHDESERRSLEIHNNGLFAEYAYDDAALAVLRQLKEKYSLVVATSRRQIVKDLTIEWLTKYYGDTFDGVYFAGIFDKGHNDQVFHATKAEVLREIHADYLIDDQIKHCFAASEAGLKAVLFGDYKWNQVDELPANVTRCHNWAAVAEYFAHEQ